MHASASYRRGLAPPSLLRAYLVAICLIGGVALAATVTALAQSWRDVVSLDPPRWVMLGVLGIGAHLVLRSLVLFQWRGTQVALAPDEAMVYVALVLLPAPLVVLFAIPAMALLQVTTRRGILIGSFNVAVLLAAGLVGTGAFLGLRALGLPAPGAAALGVVAYTLATHGLVTVVFSLREGAGALHVFRERFLLPTLLHVGLGTSLGLAFVALYAYHPLAIAAMAPFAFLVREHLKLSGRADREVLVHRRLAESSRSLVGERNADAVAAVVFDACGSLLHPGHASLTLQRPDGAAQTWRREYEGGHDEEGARIAEEVAGPDGATVTLTVHANRRTRERYGAADHAVVRIAAAEASAAFGHAHALSDLEEARARLESTSVARPLLRRIVKELLEETRADHTALLRTGRALAQGADAKDLAGLARAYAAMGLGTLAPAGRDGQRLVFEGTGLLEVTPGARATTCHLALGYLCGAVGRIEGGAALGTEVACQSRGDPACRFVVEPRHEPNAPAPPASKGPMMHLAD